MYLVQSALAVCSLGLMGICIGWTVMVAIIGKWSEEVNGPGRKCILWKVLLLLQSESGAVEVFCLIKVGK